MIHQNNPVEMEALNQYHATLPPQQKQYVRPNPNLEFKESDLPQSYQRFKIPTTGHRADKPALFDNDATLFSRNILTLCENPLIPPPPQNLKNYINMLGGIEDTIATMENSLKNNELKNLEDKYINYYVHYQMTNAAAAAPPPDSPPQPYANPFFKKPSELSSNIGIVNPLIDSIDYADQVREEEQSQHQSPGGFQQKEPKQVNPILEQSRKLRSEKQKQLDKYK